MGLGATEVPWETVGGTVGGTVGETVGEPWGNLQRSQGTAAGVAEHQKARKRRVNRTDGFDMF